MSCGLQNYNSPGTGYILGYKNEFMMYQEEVTQLYQTTPVAA